MDDPFLLFVLCAPLILVPILLLFFYGERRRGRNIAAVARQAGFQFSRDWNAASFAGLPATLSVDQRHAELDAYLAREVADRAMRAMVKARAAKALSEDGLHQTGLAGLPAITGRHNPTVTNVMSGRIDGRDVVVFEYDARRSSSHESETINQTIAAVRLPGRTLPAFMIAPRTIGQRFLAAVQHPPRIPFDHQPAFAERFIVRAEDADAVKAALTPSIVNGFMRLPAGFSLIVEGAREALALYAYNRKAAPRQFPDLARTAVDLSTVFAPR